MLHDLSVSIYEVRGKFILKKILDLISNAEGIMEKFFFLSPRYRRRRHHHWHPLASRGVAFNLPLVNTQSNILFLFQSRVSSPKEETFLPFSISSEEFPNIQQQQPFLSTRKWGSSLPHSSFPHKNFRLMKSLMFEEKLFFENYLRKYVPSTTKFQACGRMRQILKEVVAAVKEKFMGLEEVYFVSSLCAY